MKDKSTKHSAKDQILALSWTQQDIEQKFGFVGGRNTAVNNIVTFFMAIFLTLVFYIFVVLVLKTFGWTKFLADMFLERGPVPYPTVLFFFWGMSILWIKRSKLRLQSQALGLAVVPQDPEFVLTETSAQTVLERLNSLVDHPRCFILLNRIERALSNLRNIGQISDVTSILRNQSEADENQLSSSFNVVSGLVWAIPVLGFIGTVLGLSAAIGAFGKTLQSAGDLSVLKTSLQGVTGGLATSFETTLIALVGALILQMFITFQQNKELAFLDECNDYCQTHVISKLRLLDRSK